MVSVNHSSVYGIGSSQKLIGLAHISPVQFFPDVGAADIPVVLLGLLYDHRLKTALRGHLLQQVRGSGSLVAEAAVGAGHHHLCVHLSHQHVFYKIFRRHVGYLFRKGIFNQIIHSRLLHIAAPLLVGGDHRAPVPGHHASRRPAEGEHCRLQPPLLLQLHHLPQKLLVAPVPAVKLADGHHRRILNMEFLQSFQILHSTVPLQISSPAGTTVSPAGKRRCR